MRAYLPSHRLLPIILTLTTLICVCKSQAPIPSSEQIITDDGKSEFIPSHVIEFKTIETDPGFSLPATWTGSQHCLPDGSLALQTVDWKGLMNTPKGAFPKYNDYVVIVHGKRTQTISSTSITDLTDINNGIDIFPTDSAIYFLVQGSKDQPGERGPGKSPKGIPFEDFRNYLARFDLDGTYKGATELGIKCDLSRPVSCQARHLAVFPSGDMLVTVSDPDSSTLKVMYLKSSGEVVKQIDVPASHRMLGWRDQSMIPMLDESAQLFIGTVNFTAVGDKILVWHANSKEPIAEVSDGGSVREVSIQIPKGWRFADLLPANDRWVVHLRTEGTPSNGNMSRDTDAYYDLRPQDGSLAARIAEKGDIPHWIICESSGDYISFTTEAEGKSSLLIGR